MMPDLFTPAEPITLSPCQSLALRRMIEAMKADDSIYSACPDVVRAAIADFVMPPYSTAELQVKALEDSIAENLKLLEKFGSRIRALEAAARSKKAA